MTHQQIAEAIARTGQAIDDAQAEISALRAVHRIEPLTRAQLAQLGRAERALGHFRTTIRGLRRRLDLVPA